MDLEHSVNECTTSFEHLNVNNNTNNNESSSGKITGKKIEKLEESSIGNNVESTNVHNKVAVVRTGASNNDNPLPQTSPKKQNENFHIPNSIEESPEKQTILLLGGNDGTKILNTLLMLENNKQNWTELNVKLPYEIWGHGAQFLNNNIYIFGGYKGINKGLNSTYKLSKSLKWEKMADMNQTRCYISNSSVILNNQIWVCGGGSDTVEMYDPLTNRWKYMKPLNIHRYDVAVAVVNGKIFCCSEDSVECYDPSSDVWALIPNMPDGTWGHGAVGIDRNFIIIGGWNGEEYLKTVWALNTDDKNGEWIQKPSMFTPRIWFSTARIDGKVYVCGGQFKENNEDDTLDLVEIFDGEVWRNGPKMPTRRYSAPAVVIPPSFARSLN